MKYKIYSCKKDNSYKMYAINYIGWTHNNQYLDEKFFWSIDEFEKTNLKITRYFLNIIKHNISNSFIVGVELC